MTSFHFQITLLSLIQTILMNTLFQILFILLEEPMNQFFYVSNTKINRLVYFIQLAKRESTSVRVCKVGFNLLKRGF